MFESERAQDFSGHEIREVIERPRHLVERRHGGHDHGSRFGAENHVSQLRKAHGRLPRNDDERTALFQHDVGCALDEIAGEAVSDAGRSSVSQVKYVVAMLRHIIENLNEPLTASDVAEVVGLHPNYALNLFSKIMQVPLRKFIVRMRLVRARALLFETELPIASVAFAAGFSSTSQFYEQFKTAYGVTPLHMRESYLHLAPSRRARH